MKFRILGGLEAYAGARRLDIGPGKPRVLLGLLVCRANQVVPVSVLRQALWEDTPPRTAHKNLQGYISGLRGLLGDVDGVELTHRPPGYLLRVDPQQVDVLRFAELARQARDATRTGRTATAARLLREAVALWRGPVLPDLAEVPVLAEECDRLTERYLAVFEDWAEAELALGRPGELVDALDELCAAHPFRERLRRAQMLALYRTGRPGDALAAYDDLRQRLARELGISPSPPLSRLYSQILDGESADGRPSAPGVTRLPGVPEVIGRERETDAVARALGGPRPGAVLALSGAAGSGKTALAVQCAEHLAERYPDASVLLALRAADRTPRPHPEIVAELHAVLGGPPGRRVLVVLDDAAGERQVRQLLAVTGDAGVLVTSRRRLSGLEHAEQVALGPLAVESGVELLARLAGAERVAREPSAAAALVEVCGGLPLAVRVVGAKLAAVPHLPLARLAERLADERHLFDRLCVGDLQVRPRLAGWLAEVSPPDRAALHLLARSVHTEFTVDEAVAVLGGDSADAEDTVERLLERHLLETAEPEVMAHDAGPLPLAVPTLLRTLLRQGSNDPLRPGDIPLPIPA